jgi:hypothetical protein
MEISTMKRDMDLVRTILLEVERLGPPDGRLGIKIEVEGHDEPEIQGYIRLLDEAGLIETPGNSDRKPGAIWPRRLTWSGYEFLDAARDNTRWNRAKKLTLEKMGSLAFEAVKFTLLKLVDDALAGSGG